MVVSVMLTGTLCIKIGGSLCLVVLFALKAGCCGAILNWLVVCTRVKAVCSLRCSLEIVLCLLGPKIMFKLLSPNSNA